MAGEGNAVCSEAQDTVSAATISGGGEMNRLRFEPDRDKVCFMVPSRTRWIALKGLADGWVLITPGLPRFAPLGAVSGNPIDQGTFKPDVVPGFFGFKPLVPQNFLPLGLELAIQVRVPDQVTAVGAIGCVRHKIRNNDLTTM